MSLFNRLFLALLFALFTQSSSFAAIAEETVIGEFLEKNLKSGQALWLNDGQSKFFGILTQEHTGKPKGATIILHDATDNPGTAEVISPLQHTLPMHGWTTLAVQLPHLERLDDYNTHKSIFNARIVKAVEHLQSNGINNIVLIGHGTGAMAGASFLSETTEHSIRAFVGISLGDYQDSQQSISVPKLLKKINQPMLDIYGSRDLDMVVSTAKLRALTAKMAGENSTGDKSIEPFKRSAMATTQSSNVAGYIVYRQIKIEGADHSFSGLNKSLSKRILGWLERHAKGVAISSSR